ncbi:MAG: cheY [Myxococcales bacterium]|nr:cheY [Myxococcales bacterium]
MSAAAAPIRAAPVILVVEDDHDSRVMLRSVLEDAGYVVQSAANGRVALELLASSETKPQLVIVDLNMPVMDGWQLMSHLRQHAELALIPVGIQSADEDSTLPDGVSFVLHKPIDVAALLAIVKHHCG